MNILMRTSLTMSLLLYLLPSSAKSAESELLSFIPSTPDCANRGGYVKPIDTYCGRSDLDLTRPHHVTKALLEALGEEPIKVARLAIWAVTDVTFAIAFCKKIVSTTQELTIIVQRDTKSELVVDYLIDCAKRSGVPTVFGGYAGLAVGGINSFHPKLVYVETPTRSMAFVGSGNITQSRMNTDYFALFGPITGGAVVGEREKKASEFVAWIGCVTAGLATKKQGDTRDGVAAVREGCRVRSPSIFPSVYIMPTDARRILLRFSYLSAVYDEISILSQGFNSNDVDWILQQALVDRKKVRLLLDDDIYWSKFDPSQRLMNDVYEYDEHVSPLMANGADVRLLITNHNEIIGNYQHAKLYLFRRVGTDEGVCFIGSANSTSSAFGDNLEVLTELSGSSCRSVLGWFDGLWSRGVDHGQMPKGDPLR